MGLHDGHRGRMREKLRLYGSDVFHSHEILEMLLFHAVAQRNTNPIAKELINRFGSLDGVFSASREELMTIEGVGPKIADMLIAVGKIGVTDDEVNNDSPGMKFDDYNLLGEFFRDYLSECTEYKVVMMLLNNKLECIELVDMYNGDYGMSGVRADNFLDEAIRKRAAVVAIAHSHPYGPAFPTPSDIATNNMLSAAFASIGITLIEDYVVSGKNYVGFMKNLSAAFMQMADIKRFLESKG